MTRIGVGDDNISVPIVFLQHGTILVIVLSLCHARKDDCRHTQHTQAVFFDNWTEALLCGGFFHFNGKWQKMNFELENYSRWCFSFFLGVARSFPVAPFRRTTERVAITVTSQSLDCGAPTVGPRWFAAVLDRLYGGYGESLPRGKGPAGALHTAKGTPPPPSIDFPESTR